MNSILEKTMMTSELVRLINAATELCTSLSRLANYCTAQLKAEAEDREI